MTSSELKPKVFVAMPFKSDYDKVYSSIKAAADMAGMDAQRIDKELFAGSIISHIISSLESADFVVAEVSENNGNVYYEIGLAHCQKKPVVLLATDLDALRFDLRDHRVIRYDAKDPTSFEKPLAQTLSTLRNDKLDAHASLENRYGGNYKRALEKIKATLKDDLGLQEPIEITAQHKLSNGEIAIEAVDFFGKKVRAIVDVNGIVRRSEKV
jgi:hypothetical protein